MLASLVDAPLVDPLLVYEPKYDGIRAVADVPPSGRVRLWSRLGNEKTAQFPEIARALGAWARRRKKPAVLDGEIVALDAKGEPTGFQKLQGRIHETQGRHDSSTAFILFDILRDGRTDLRERPLTERRAILEKVLAGSTSPLLRISEQVRGDGRALYDRALHSGWEGLIAKQADSRYKSGKRTPEWRKLKIVHEQEFVVGGWTEPRQTRAYFGALLLGVYEGTDLVYVGHTGTGFNEKELARVMKLLRAHEIAESPFRQRPRTNERPHWVRPELVAQIKFTEWTADDKLRHPVYLGLRDDKRPADVRREQAAPFHATTTMRRGSPAAAVAEPGPSAERVVEQLRALEDARRDGTVELPGGAHIAVTNLHKPFWPALKLTKGDLFRYYAQVARYLLPAIADRPLVMKRYPNGVDRPPFYQHRAEQAPPGVRVEMVTVAEERPHIIGGSLASLMYTTQLAAISQDPWFSRVQTPESADHVALDLDPSEGVPFARVLDVARAIRDELERLGAEGFPKTSGASGLHIYVPLPAGTPYDAGLILAQIIATVVATRHPAIATVERSVRARGSRVYVDYLQNILGKTLASAYSARASAYAGVATPLTWKELDAGVRREDFTIRTTPARLAAVGDLWAGLREAKGVDLERVAAYAERAGTRAKGEVGRLARRSAGSS